MAGRLRWGAQRGMGLRFLDETKDDHEMLIGDIKVKGEPRQVSSICLNTVWKLIVDF